MSAVTHYVMSRQEARDRTDAIKRMADRLWTALLEVHEGRAWEALGYPSWREYAQTEFNMSQSQAYRLLDAGKVLREIEDAAGSPMGELINERATRDIKPHLEAVKDEVRERVDSGEDPHIVVPEVIERTRDEAREHADMVRRFIKGLDQFAVGWIYIQSIGHHEHRDELLAKADPLTREAVEEFESRFGRVQR